MASIAIYGFYGFSPHLWPKSEFADVVVSELFVEKADIVELEIPGLIIS